MTHPTNFHSGFHSLFQSAVRKVLGDRGEHDQGLGAGHSVAQAAANALKAHLEGGKLEGKAETLEVCAKLALELAEAKVKGDDQRVDQLESELKDSTCDPGWAESVLVFMEYYALHGDPMYRDEDIPAYALPPGKSPDVLTVGLLGDWGTGAPEADTVLRTMVEEFDPDVIVHVGDVYYAGTKDENRENYLRALNDVRAKKRPIPVYGVPGNHDYYNGGSGFYEVQIAEVNGDGLAPPGTPVQTTSYFCLQNDSWQLQGMDTGYHDHDLFQVAQDYTKLRDSEAAWYRRMLEDAGDRKVLLFSHHQLFSAFANIGTKEKGTHQDNYNQDLLDVFGPYLDKGEITAWFWGHEHLLEIYDPYVGLDKGRCVGHSAFPILALQDPYEVKYPQVPLAPSQHDGQDFIKLGVSDEVYNHGFVILGLSTDRTGKANYFEMAGDDSSGACRLIYSEEL